MSEHLATADPRTSSEVLSAKGPSRRRLLYAAPAAERLQRETAGGRS
jgi:hypothetical protein